MTGVQTCALPICWFYRNDIINSSGENNIIFPTDTIGYLVGGEMFLIKTTDAGASWNKTIINDDFLNVYFKDELNGFINGSSKIYKTTDGGTTLTVLETFPYNEIFSIRAMTFNDSLEGFVGTNFPARIYKTIDGGLSWYKTNINGIIDTTSLIKQIFFITPFIGWAIQNNVVFKTTDGGENWWFQQNLLDEINDVFFIDTLIGWITNNSSIRNPYKTTDGGNSWIEQINSNIYFSRYVFFKDSLNGYITRPNILYYTTDAGFNWFQNSTVTDFGQGRFGYFDSNNFFITGTKVYRTTNGGDNWTEFPELEEIGRASCRERV